jgi:hypothetical protein
VSSQAGTLFAVSLRKQCSMEFEMNGAISIDQLTLASFSLARYYIHQDRIHLQHSGFTLGDENPSESSLFGCGVRLDLGLCILH